MGYAKTLMNAVKQHSQHSQVARLATGNALLNGWQSAGEKAMLSTPSKQHPSYSSRVIHRMKSNN